jgi:integrase
MGLEPTTTGTTIQKRGHWQPFEKSANPLFFLWIALARHSPMFPSIPLVFPSKWGTYPHGDTLGHPLQISTLGQREFKRLIMAAGVRLIKFHGLRHTCATLLLQAGVLPHVVQERLGHKRIEITLETYAHVLPSMQQDAAAKLAAILQL